MGTVGAPISKFAVLRPGGGMGAGGRLTELVGALGEGGGSGADGSCTGAEARPGDGADGVPPLAGTGEVDSRGWVTPAPGRAVELRVRERFDPDPWLFSLAAS